MFAPWVRQRSPPSEIDQDAVGGKITAVGFAVPGVLSLRLGKIEDGAADQVFLLAIAVQSDLARQSRTRSSAVDLSVEPLGR